jgi:predicted NAD-dependent protein-ADP-ribosyltransferase YbiA (DUF1768 family)
MDKLVFYSGSSFAPPTRGIHEAGNPADYTELAEYSGWRRMLSNFDTSESFEWDGIDLGFGFPKGTRWRSIEHVFQGAKMSLAGLRFGLRFTLTYGDFIGFGEGSLAQLNRKLVPLNKAQLARWDAVKDRVMESATHAKYIQNIDSRWAKMLRSTKNAELWHLQRQRARASALVRFEHLEKLRTL